MDSAHALAVVCRAKQISREQGVVAQDEILGYLCQCADINGSWMKLVRPVHGAAEAPEQALAQSTLLQRHPVPHATPTVSIDAQSSSYRAPRLQLHLIPKMRPVKHRTVKWMEVQRWTMFTWSRFVTCAIPSSVRSKTVLLSLPRERDWCLKHTAVYRRSRGLPAALQKMLHRAACPSSWQQSN